MRRAEIQEKRDFGRGDVPLLNRYAQVARAREVAVDIGAKAGISGSLRRLPLAQFGSVLAGFHERRFPSIAIGLVLANHAPDRRAKKNSGHCRGGAQRATPSITHRPGFSVGKIFVSAKPAASKSARNSSSERCRPPVLTSMFTSFAAAPRLGSDVSMRGG